MSGPPKVVVLGLMSKMPVAGVVWQTVHYLVGLERLGFETYYVEAHARTPSMLMQRKDDDASARAATFIERMLHRFGLSRRWAFHALHSDGRCYGMAWSDLARLYRSAALIINLHGGTKPLPEHYENGRLLYLETDPVQLQIELHDNVKETVDLLEPHVAFFTFGENLGRSDCLLPVSERFPFHATRQPVVLDFWAGHERRHRDVYTTVGNWQQAWRTVEYRGQTYWWSKDQEFLKFIDLPARTGRTFELALGSYGEKDQALLEEHGWRVRSGVEVSRELDPYRDYIASSKGEFTVAKDQNVRLRSGWFSDRSATYLAAGRPVVTQDTGFARMLPSGDGLFAVSDADQAAAAIEEVEGDYERHAAAASLVARTCFSSDVVLKALLDTIGLRAPALRPHRHAPLPPPLPAELVLTPLSRRPLVLAPETVQAVLQRPVPSLGSEPRSTSLPRTSVVVVTFENLVCTRMCLESLLSDPEGAVDEVVVVDNASSDDTPAYLASLTLRAPIVRAVLNETNRGFAAAVNQGLELATGERCVVLNNDTIVPPGSLGRLVRCLDDLSLGMVGPVTNAAGNGARVMTGYRTYGQMVDFARARETSHRGQTRDLHVLHMFCVALRREVIERVGLLDERFGLGLFEDDDYSRRVRSAGLRVACADDVLVHHFGEASLGKLFASGAYAELFARNRRLYEEKWGTSWQAALDRSDPEYEDLVRRIRMAVSGRLPEDAAVGVVSRGDDELLRLGGRQAWHFPGTEAGGFAGHYPADSAEALQHLEALRGRGATHLLFPVIALWWLDHYVGLRTHLERAGEPVRVENACVIFPLQEPAP